MILKEDILLNTLKAPKLYTNNEQVLRIIDALIPGSTSIEERELLALFYIRCIKTNSTLYYKLSVKDKYNSYLCLPTVTVEKPSGAVKMDNIYQSLKTLNIIPYTRDVGFVDTLLVALEQIIDAL